MRMLRRLYRLARLVPHVIRGVFEATTILPRNRPPETEREWRTIRRWSFKAVGLAGVDVRIHGEPIQGGAMFVSNHVSWLDIGVLSSVVDAGFIGKSELAHWPVLGFLIARGGTVFIERGGDGAAANANREMAQRLEQDGRIAVFPEGTTTDGSMRRFHPRLFEAVKTTGKPVQPVAVRYDNEMAPFIGEQTFLGNLWRVLGERRITADLWVLPAIEIDGQDRRSLARAAESAVRGQLMPAPATDSAGADEEAVA